VVTNDEMRDHHFQMLHPRLDLFSLLIQSNVKLYRLFHTLSDCGQQIVDCSLF
jgi:hypothetical protein